MIFDRGVAKALREQGAHHILMVVTDFSLMVVVNHQNELECNQINKNYI